jgi:hypothetical protein
MCQQWSQNVSGIRETITRMTHPADFVYCLKPYAIVETFDDKALLLNATNHFCCALNATEAFILAHTTGYNSSQQLAALTARFFQITEQEASQAVVAFYEKLKDWDFVEDVVPNNQVIEEKRSMEDKINLSNRYLKNPDVGLREEDTEGGLLFNPDNNEVKILNFTGLFVWQRCDGTRTLSDIVNDLCDNFEDAPVAQVGADIQDFIEDMVDAGFIGLPNHES